nr:5-deoxy-glucuronate isomerase [Streptomyces sp. NBC_00886]
MTTAELYVPKGAAATAGGTHHFTTGDSERTVLPPVGGCTVRIEDEEFQFLGRESVFAGVTDFAYVPRDARAQIASGAGGRFALAGAKCERRLPARYGPAPEVPVERRGNWSSCPPHQHDGQRAGEEVESEEIYYFEIDGPNGFGAQRVFPSREGGSDVLTEVRSGDAVLVPDGRHGPSIAQPGHDMYYLDVMAGPDAAREWRICFHPDHVESTEGYR